MSGVDVADECVEVYNEMKSSFKYRYITYTINREQDAVVVADTLPTSKEESGASPEQKYASFLKVLEKDYADCCYALYDFEHTQQAYSRVILILWTPNNARPMSKMLYSSTYDALRRELPGVYRYVVGEDTDEIKWDVIVSKL